MVNTLSDEFVLSYEDFLSFFLYGIWNESGFMWQYLCPLMELYNTEDYTIIRATGGFVE